MDLFIGIYSTCFISMSAGPDFVSVNVAIFLFPRSSAPTNGKSDFL